jgi:hypothetical protein
VYDAVGDPVYVAEVTRVIGTGDSEVEQVVETPQGPQVRENDAHVRGSGGTSGGALHVVRVPDAPSGSEADRADPERSDAGRSGAPAPADATTAPPSGAPVLLGTWVGHPQETVLACLVP